MQPDEITYDVADELHVATRCADLLPAERVKDLVKLNLLDWWEDEDGEGYEYTMPTDVSRRVDEMEASHPDAVTVDLGYFCEARCPHCNGELDRLTRLEVTIDRHGQPLWNLTLSWSFEVYTEAFRRFYGSTHVG